MNADTKTLEQRALPCPFCGGTKIGVQDGDTFRWRMAVCGECGAQAGDVRAQTSGKGTPEEWETKARVAAIAEWNKRAALSSAAEAKVVKYDRQFIAEMLDEFAPRATYYIYSSDEVREQARLLRAADEADAAGVRTAAWPTGVLNRDRTLEVLTKYNEWRRGAKGPQSDPRMVGLAIDAAIAYIATPPAASAGPEGYLFRGLPILIDPSPETEGEV